MTGRYEQLLSRTERVGDCLIWLGYIDARNGYPGNKEHRTMLALKLGRPVAKGMDTCHTCDTRACINPDHLYEGSRAQNMADCSARNRHNKPTGAHHWCSTISDDDVRDMRQLTALGWSRKEIADRFSVNPATVSRIVRNIWRTEVTA